LNLSLSVTALLFFPKLQSAGRRRSKKQVAEQKTSGKAELKIVPAITKVEPRELDKYFDKVGILPQGVSLPKVASSSSLISEEEVLAAHKAWGEGLCLIAKTYEDKGYDEAKKVAQQVLDAAYGYAKGIPVLFKPTLASGSQTFRTTEEGALSYFVGGNKKYPRTKRGDTKRTMKGMCESFCITHHCHTRNKDYEFWPTMVSLKQQLYLNIYIYI